MTRIWFLFIIFTVFFINISHFNASGQIPGFDLIKTTKDVPDSIEVNQLIAISNVNKEIEYTDNLILKVHYSNDLDSKQRELLQIINTFNVYVTQQGAEFREFKLGELSHYFLINAKYTWQEYYNNLRIHQGYIQKLIRENQRYQNSFIVNKVKWQNSLPTLRKDLSGNMLSHINGNIAKINKVIKVYDSQLQDLITSENDIIEDIIFVDNILNDIDYFIEKRRSELFVKNEEGIFNIEYMNSYDGSFFERIKLAYYENTKTISYSINYVRNNFVTYIIVLLLSLLYIFFIRKKYIGLNYDDNISGYKKVSRIIAKRPVVLAFAIALILWLVSSQA